MKTLLRILAIPAFILVLPVLFILAVLLVSCIFVLMLGFKYKLTKDHLTMKSWINPTVIIRISKHQVLVHGNDHTKLFGTFSH